MSIAELLLELAKVSKEERDAMVKAGTNMIRLKPNPKIEVTPEVQEYMDTITKRMNTPEVLDAIQEEIAEFDSQLMIYGTAMMKNGKVIKRNDISPPQ